MVLCLMPTVYFFVAAFFWYTTRWDQSQQYFYLYQTGCTLPLWERNKNALQKRRRKRLASDEGKGNKVITHLFTSSAFDLRPFAGSPLHFNQNFSSSFFNSEGLRTQIEALGISFSLRSDARNVANAAMFVLLWPHWPRSDVVVTILPELSAIMKVVYVMMYFLHKQKWNTKQWGNFKKLFCWKKARLIM